MKFKQSPILETFSFGRDPLWRELTNVHGQDIVYSDELSQLDTFCNQVAGRIPFTSVYGRRIKVSLLELSSCFVVRSEHHYNKDERRRLSLRKHFYEEDSDHLPFFSIPSASWAQVAEEIASHLKFTANDPQVVKIVSALTARDEWRTSQSFENWAMEKLFSLLPPADAIFILYQILMPYADPTLRARVFDGKENWGEYLGFVDLRMYSRTSPVAMALLVPPRCYRNDDAVNIICGNYSPLFGSPGFNSCAYTMHDPKSGGATCTQSAIINCLTLLADRGAWLLGGYTLTYLGKTRIRKDQFGDVEEGCFFEPSNDGQTSNATHVQGMTFDEVSAVLSPKYCGVNRDPVRLPWNEGEYTIDGDLLPIPDEKTKEMAIFDSEKLAERLIIAYVKARCPIILYVNSQRWYSELIPGFKDDPKVEAGHAVVIVGYRRASKPNLYQSDPMPGMVAVGGNRIEGFGCYPRISELIVNDSGYAPFQKLAARRCFAAAVAFDDTENGYPGHLQFHCVMPINLKVGATDCIRALCRANNPKNTREYTHWYSYFHKVWARVENTDYRIDLLHRDDIIPSLFQTASYPFDIGGGLEHDTKGNLFNLNFKRVFDQIQKLPNSLFWCISGYRNVYGLDSIWLFDAQQEMDVETPWLLAFHWNEFGWMSSEPDVPQKNLSVEMQTARNVNVKEHSTVSVKESLQRSVITSCSPKPLENLIRDLQSISGLSLIDLYVLRDVDLRHMKAVGMHLEQPSDLPAELDADSSAIVMSLRSNVEVVADWVEEIFKSCRQTNDIAIAALATYFPHITNRSRQLFAFDNGEKLSRRQLATKAIANTVRLACELRDRGVMKHAVVEIVAGTILDDCHCNRCIVAKAHDKHVIFESTKKSKIRMLCEGLLDVVNEVNQPDWAFAIELEPGATYVINSGDSIRQLLDIANKDYSELVPHLGLNLDIAHANITRRKEALEGKVALLDFREFKDYVVHAHICDTPGMHTRDQQLGTWTPVEHHNSSEYGDLRLLTELANDIANRKTPLPFTGAVAVELEGCGRMAWVHTSLSRLLYMSEFVKHS